MQRMDGDRMLAERYVAMARDIRAIVESLKITITGDEVDIGRS